jgi:hypothetical protein
LQSVISQQVCTARRENTVDRLGVWFRRRAEGEGPKEKGDDNKEEEDRELRRKLLLYGNGCANGRRWKMATNLR